MIATSTEALKGYPLLKKLFPQTTKNIGLVELVVKNQNEITSNQYSNSGVVGIHYRPQVFSSWQMDIQKIARKMSERENRELGNYISFHADLLTDIPKNYSPREWLLGLENKVADMYNIQLLIENTSPRVDSTIPKWVYDWNSFQDEFGDIIEDSNGKLGCCVDIAHMMISTPNIREQLMKYKIGDTIPVSLQGLMFALRNAGEVHWSRSDGCGLYENRLMFQVASQILKHVNNKTLGQMSNSLCAFADNIIHNHFSMIGDGDFREKLYQILEFINFTGVIVNEAPLLLEAVRERFPPLGNLPDKQRLGIFC